jgi:hypothetical protein
MNRESNRPFGRYRDKYTLVGERHTASDAGQIHSIGIPTTTTHPPGLRNLTLPGEGMLRIIRKRLHHHSRTARAIVKKETVLAKVIDQLGL